MSIPPRLLVVAASALLVSCAGSPPPAEVLPPPPAPFVTSRQLDGPPPMGGETVQGKAGDWLLRNEHLSVVVADAGPDRAGTAGDLIDAAPAGGRDALRGVSTGLGDSLLVPVRYRTVRTATAPDSALQVLVAEGAWSAPPRAPGSGPSTVSVETRYELRAGSAFLTVRTTVVNEGADTLAALALGDIVEWGRAEPYAPGVGRLSGAAPGALPFAAATGEGSGYAWVSTAGDVGGRHDRARSELTAATVNLAPGDTATFERLLFVVRGSAADAQDAAWAAKGRPVGKVRAEVEGDDGGPVAGASVEAVDPGGTSRGLGRTDARGWVTLALPPGQYRLAVRHPRRGPAEREREVRVEQGKQAHASFKLPAAATVTLVSVDVEGRPSPATWIFTGTEGTPDPDLGPRWRADGAGRAVFSGTGGMRVELPAGRYRVTAARGPAFEPWETETTFHAGREAAIQAVLTPLDLPPGWTAVRTGVRTWPDSGTVVAPADRARELAAEGVRWFAPTDSRRTGGYAAAIDSLSLAAPLGILAGFRVATGPLGRSKSIPADSIGAAPGSEGGIESLGPGPEAGFEPRWRRWIARLDGGGRPVAIDGFGAAALDDDLPWGPRSYVFTGAGPATADSVAAAVRRGRVVVSDGAFLDIRLGGKTAGDTLVTAPGPVRGHLRVTAASPVEVRRVTVIVNGKADSIFMVRGRDRSIRFDEEIEAEIAEPGYVLVRVDGVIHSYSPSGAPDGHELDSSRKSITFSNPIWVEIPESGS